MSNTRIQNGSGNNSASSVSLGLPAEQIGSQDIIAYISRELPKNIEENSGVPDYEKFARQCIAFAKNKDASLSNEYLKNLFGNAGKEMIALLHSNSSESSKVYEILVKNLFSEIDRQLTIVPVKRDPSVDYGFRIPTGSWDEERANLWMKVNSKGILNGGVYRSGDPLVAATPYLAFKYDFLDMETNYIKLKIAGGIGAFSALPSQDFRQRYTVGVLPSLLLFFGANQTLYKGLKLREGVELKPMLPVGMHVPVDILWPIRAGLSLGYEFSDDISLAIGALATLYFYPRDVQDLKTFMPNYDNTDLFLNLRTPVVDLKAGIEFYLNETTGVIEIEKDVRFKNNYSMWVSLQGRYSFTGGWVGYPPSVFLSVGFGKTNESNKQGVSVEAGLNPFKQMFKSGIHFQQNDWDYNPVSYREEYTRAVYHMGFVTESDPITCWHKPMSPDFVGNKYNCNIPFEEADCFSQDGVIHCFFGESAIELKPDGWDLNDDKGGGNCSIAEGLTPSLPVMYDLNKANSLDEYIDKINSDKDSAESKLSLLARIAKTLYATYDKAGTVSASGSGDDNDIGFNETFKRMKDYLFNPDPSKDTSVCRGIAKFVAHLASRIGFEAHVASISHYDMKHTIVLLREPHGQYRLIDSGEGIEYTSAMSVLEALQDHIRYSTLPPQAKYVLYDGNGKYERTLLTNEGRMLIESTTPPDALMKFLGLEK